MGGCSLKCIHSLLRSYVHSQARLPLAALGTRFNKTLHWHVLVRTWKPYCRHPQGPAPQSSWRAQALRMHLSSTTTPSLGPISADSLYPNAPAVRGSGCGSGVTILRKVLLRNGDGFATFAQRKEALKHLTTVPMKVFITHGIIYGLIIQSGILQKRHLSP